MNEGRIDMAAEHCAVAFTSDWVPPTTDAYWDYLIGQGAGRTVAILWSGNEHNGKFLLQQKPPFRVYDPEGEELRSGARRLGAAQPSCTRCGRRRSTRCAAC